MNHLLMPFFRHFADDQRRFWMAPTELRRPTVLRTFVTFAGLTGVAVASDRSIEKQVPGSHLQRSQDISNYAVFSLVGSAAGAYAFGHLEQNEHLRETGFLSGEATLNSILSAFAIQQVTRRQRPYVGDGKGAFFAGGNSFPSQHAAVAWSVASVVAHEYPGPLTKVLAYGLASTVSATRITGGRHFASDVIVGSALGWYLGRQVYHSRHDLALAGSSWNQDPSDLAEEPRSPRKMGSPYVPLDSWVYPAIERLSAFGYLPAPFIGLKPWTRMECAQLVEEADEAWQQQIDDPEPPAMNLQERLRQEFAYELRRLQGGSNLTARLPAARAARATHP